MAIQMRRGLMDDFDPDKMLPGEWAVSIDRQTERQIVWMCFSPGVTKRMGTYEDFYAQIEEATEGILAEYKAELNVIAQEVRELAEAVSKDREYVASAHTEIKDVYIPQIEGYLTQAEGFRDQAESYSGQAEASAQSASQSAQDASDSADAAEKSEQATAVLAASASQSEKNANQSATQAAASAQSAAADKAETERLAGEVAEDLQEVTELATQAGTDAGRAETAATAAEKSAGTAGEAEKQAKNYSDLSKSYAVGTGNTVRENDETDNSKYYYEQSKRISQGFTGLIPMGTVTFEQLSELEDLQTGYLYNISNAFTSDGTFQGGAGVEYGAGSNVYRTAEGYWDVLAGNAVTGISIGTNGEMKQGNVTVPTATGDAIGLVKPDGDTITVGEDGTLSVADGFVPEIKIATTQAAGIVKPDGKTITVDEDGTITGASTEFTGTTQEYEQAKESGEIAEGTIVNITDDYSGGSGGGGGSVTLDSEVTQDSENAVKSSGIHKFVQNIVAGIGQKITELGTIIANVRTDLGTTNEQASELKESLKDVAFSGNYSDLTGTPQIPTVPDALKNPHALKFTGAVTESYDGSEEKTVNIPNIIVDEALSDTSENPVQNKAISLQVNELKKSVSDGKALVAGAITEKGVQTAADADFKTMADNILAISSEKKFPEIGNNLVVFTKGEQYNANDNTVNAKIEKGSGNYDWEYTLITGNSKSIQTIDLQNYSYFSLDSFKRKETNYDFKSENKKEVTITVKWTSQKNGSTDRNGSIVMNLYSQYIYRSYPTIYDIEGGHAISANLKGMDGYVGYAIPAVPLNYLGLGTRAVYDCFIAFFFGEEIIIPLVCASNGTWNTKINDATISITQ